MPPKCQCTSCPWGIYRLELIEICMRQFEACQKHTYRLDRLTGKDQGRGENLSKVRRKLETFSLEQLEIFSKEKSDYEQVLIQYERQFLENYGSKEVFKEHLLQLCNSRFDAATKLFILAENIKDKAEIFEEWQTTRDEMKCYNNEELENIAEKMKNNLEMLEARKQEKNIGKSQSRPEKSKNGPGSGYLVEKLKKIGNFFKKNN